MKKTPPTKKADAAPAKTLTTPKAIEAAAKKLKAAKEATAPAAASKPAPKAAAAKAAKPAAEPKAPKAAKASAPKAATPAKAAAAQPLVTKVIASIDVGFGNSLTIRGEGPGLSWDSGVTMVCSEDGSAWVWSTAEATAPITFKVLANDLAWCAGEDFVVTPGATLTVSPIF